MQMAVSYVRNRKQIVITVRDMKEASRSVRKQTCFSLTQYRTSVHTVILLTLKAKGLMVSSVTIFLLRTASCRISKPNETAI